MIRMSRFLPIKMKRWEKLTAVFARQHLVCGLDVLIKNNSIFNAEVTVVVHRLPLASIQCLEALHDGVECLFL